MSSRCPDCGQEHGGRRCLPFSKELPMPSPTPSGLLFDIGYELQVLAFGAPVDRPRIVRLLERIKEEKPVSEKLPTVHGYGGPQSAAPAPETRDIDACPGATNTVFLTRGCQHPSAAPLSAARKIYSSTHGEGHTTGVGGHEERVTVITPSDKGDRMFDIPQEIIEAEQKVSIWMAEQNVTRWKLGGSQQRGESAPSATEPLQPERRKASKWCAEHKCPMHYCSHDRRKYVSREGKP